MDTEDGHLFIKKLAYFIRTHEKALANSLQFQRQPSKQTSSSIATSSRKQTSSLSTAGSTTSSTLSSTSVLANAALSLSNLALTSQNAKAAKLYLTPNQLYYLLSRFEELGVFVGHMNVRLEDIHAGTASSNYVSFITQTKRPKGRASDQESITSVSSVRSMMSSMSSMWSNFTSSNSAAKIEKRKAQELDDLKYLYSAFTKIPSLKLASDHRISRIAGYEEFPFDTAVPIHAFKNVSALEIVDLDFRAFYGWDRLADQLKSLSVKRASVEDVTDLLTNIVLDDMDRRRRRSCKTPTSPVQTHVTSTPGGKHGELSRSMSTPDPAMAETGRGLSESPAALEPSPRRISTSKALPRMHSVSPSRPGSSRRDSSHRLNRAHTKNRRNSESSTSSRSSVRLRSSSSNLLSYNILPGSKWQFLRHLSLADNGLTTISASSLTPVVSTLQSLDLSANLFTEVPDSLVTLVALRALNLSNCMIDSLHSLSKSPLPAITVLNLRGNRISSLAGIEKLLSLERLDLRDNKLVDPMELARLTGMPEFRDVYIIKNPFTKSHNNHRVTIFNLFRKSPGYTDDITIDSTGPGYTERKYLEDRVPEKTNVPIVKPPVEDDEPSAILVEQELSRATEDPIPPAPPQPEPQTPISVDRLSKTSRRRKGARRRVVDVSSTGSPGSKNSQEESPEMTFVTAVQTPAFKVKSDRPPRNSIEESPELSSSKAYEYGSGRPLSVGSVKSGSLSNDNSGLKGDRENALADAGSLSFSSEMYKKKIEALKKDFGANWLSAIESDRWDGISRKSIEEVNSAPAMQSTTVGGSSTTTTVKTTVTTSISTGRRLG